MNRLPLLLALGMGALLPAALAGNEPLPATFSFSGTAPAGATAVEASTSYSHDLGYGYDLGTTPSADNPYYFSIAVPEGDYDVTVTLGDATAATVTTVKAESRRLMLERIETAPGQFVTRTFTVNVRNASLPASGDYPASQVLLDPREKGVLHWDDKLTLEFDGPHSGLVSLTVAPTHAIRVFIAGDSTVTDQPREPWNSWGQSLTRFFGRRRRRRQPRRVGRDPQGLHLPAEARKGAEPDPTRRLSFHPVRAQRHEAELAGDVRRRLHDL